MTPIQRISILLTLLAGCTTLDAPSELPPPPRADELVGTPVYQPMFVVPMPELASMPSARGQLQALNGRDTGVQDVLLTLFKDSDLNLLVDADVDGTMTFDIKDTSVEEAFEALLASLDLAYEWDGSFLRIKPTARRTFDVDLLDASLRMLRDQQRQHWDRCLELQSTRLLDS